MKQEQIRFRPYRSDDLTVLQRIRRAAFEPVFRSFRDLVGRDIASVVFARADEEQAELLAKVCRPGSGHEVVVVERGGETVGFVSWSMDESARVGEIGLNAVHPDHSGIGIGRQMYELALVRMKESGMVVATVGTGGDPSHAPARRAYEKVGFEAYVPSIHMYKML